MINIHYYLEKHIKAKLEKYLAHILYPKMEGMGFLTGYLIVIICHIVSRKVQEQIIVSAQKVFLIEKHL